VDWTPNIIELIMPWLYFDVVDEGHPLSILFSSRAQPVSKPRDVLFQLYVETRLPVGVAALFRVLRGVGPAKGLEES